MCKNTANPISCTAGDVKRLNDSTVLVCAKGEWHALCSDQNTWTTAQAKVACRQLGMNPNGTVYATCNINLHHLLLFLNT